MSSIRERALESIERSLPDAIRQRYAAKFGVLLLCVVVVLAVGGALVHLETGSLVESQTEEQIRGVAESESSSVSEWASSKQSTASFLADAIGDRSASASDHQRWLEQKLIGLPGDVRALHYVDAADGSVVASTDDDLSGMSLAAVDAPWTDDSGAVVSSGPTGTSRPYESGDEPVIAFVQPVAGSDRFVVLTASLESRSHRFTSPFATGDVKVVGADGTIILDNRKDSILQEYATTGEANETAVDAALSGETGYAHVAARTGMEDGEYVMAYTPVTGTEWALLYHVPAERAFALQSAVSENIVLLVALAVGALFVVGVTIGRGTARALSRVAETAEDIAAGDINSTLPETARVDEMGQLYDSFASMQSYLTTAADQADALAEKRFDDPALEESIPGEFGAALEEMGDDIQTLITDVEDARDEAESMATALESKASEFSDVMDEAAAGDLTQRMDTDSDYDAMVDIAESFNEMVAELERTVDRIEEFAGSVDASTDAISASAQEVRSASEQVSRSVQQIADGAEEQNENIQQVSDEMTDLSATVEEITSSTDEVASKSQRAVATGESGREFAEAAAEEIDAIDRKSSEAIEQVESLAEEIDRIGEVTTLIDDIAEQTNMLALNASIEASRAGEAGEGFAVVADEIKTLAEETQDATDDIESQIDEIQSRTEATVGDIREMDESVETGKETVKNATDALTDIVQQVDEANDGVQAISDATDEQAASMEEVVSMAEEVGSISEETSSESETVAASAEEQTASITEVTEKIQTLSSQTSDLKALISQFETGTVSEAGESGGRGRSEAAPTDD